MNKQDTLARLHSRMRACRLCKEAGHEITPGAIFSGDGSAQVMIIGQAPGVTEVEADRPFNAGSGRRLFEWLGQAGWDEDAFRKRHYMTAVTKCYPGKNVSGRGDRVPSKAEQALCRPYLDQEFALVEPSLIIPVGSLAIKLFFPANSRLGDVIGSGYYISSRDIDEYEAYSLQAANRHDSFPSGLAKGGRWLVPLPHPSGASQWPNREENKRLIGKTIELLAEIKRAWAL